ncbi:hypothetical protein ACPF04_05555 [Campylobacter sp. MOP51]|uniref:hypothetical protein n=1 Tax=Campylobacter canis TaxID=3378588 RepID=UPI003C45B67B
MFKIQPDREISVLSNGYALNIGHINSICEMMKTWRDERRIAVASQVPGYLKNSTEELDELKEAVCNFDEHEHVDAICDILVFTFNAVEMPSKDWVSNLGNLYLSAITSSLKVDGFREVEMLSRYRDMFNRAILESARIKEEKANGIQGKPAKYNAFDQAIRLWVLSDVVLKNMGYDLFKAMEETYKEISSRRGAWSDEAKKWIKDTSPEAKAAEYKADFNNARL